MTPVDYLNLHCAAPIPPAGAAGGVVHSHCSAKQQFQAGPVHFACVNRAQVAPSYFISIVDAKVIAQYSATIERC